MEPFAGKVSVEAQRKAFFLGEFAIMTRQ